MHKTKEIQNQKYSFLAKFFHWGFVLLFGYGIFKQVDNIEQLEDISLLKSEIRSLHFLEYTGAPNWEVAVQFPWTWIFSSSRF